MPRLMLSQGFLLPEPWADPTSGSTLEFSNLHHRSNRDPDFEILLVGSSRGVEL